MIPVKIQKIQKIIVAEMEKTIKKSELQKLSDSEEKTKSLCARLN